MFQVPKFWHFGFQIVAYFCCNKTQNVRLQLKGDQSNDHATRRAQEPVVQAQRDLVKVHGSGLALREAVARTRILPATRRQQRAVEQVPGGMHAICDHPFFNNFDDLAPCLQF